MSDDNNINIEVDGKVLSAHKGQMLIEVTDANDIYIPRFCYHKKLSVAANCRMCLVEVDKSPKLLPACATPVMEGMKVKTNSQITLDAQKSVMEFLLINHPLDCPVCDQGGECELQDLAVGCGRDVSRYQEKKRVVVDKNIGPLIQTDLTRCINCMRCVRFGEEIAGVREIGAIGRGENTTISTYVQKSITSELSGNIIDLCPVGALTSKPFRFSARTWELIQKDGVAPHDSVGSNIHFHVKNNKVKRVVPADNDDINEVWLSDRDRFSYEAIYSDDRLESPMIKRSGKWETVDWETALTEVKERLNSVINKTGAESINALASPSSTLEELYLLQKIMRSLGSHNIDTRLRQTDFSDQKLAPVFPWLGKKIKDIESVDSILLIGSNVCKEQPLINHRLRKAVLKGASCSVVNSIDYEFNYPISKKIIAPPSHIVDELIAILKALFEIKSSDVDNNIKKIVKNCSCSDTHRDIAKELINSDNCLVLLGNLSFSHLQFSFLRSLAGWIAKLSGSCFGYLSEGANASGSWLAGAVPHRLAGGKNNTKTGMTVGQMLNAKSGNYLLMNVEPEMDCWDSFAAYNAMKNANLVVALTSYRSTSMEDYADIMLPVSVFAETSGTYINNEGTMQSFTGAVSPLGNSRPLWKVLRVLGNCLNLNGFDYQVSTDVLDEAISKIGDIKGDNFDKWSAKKIDKPKSDGLQRITDVPMNMVDGLCRRAKALQDTNDVSKDSIYINEVLADKSKLKEGDKAKVEQDNSSVIMNVIINDRVPDDCVLVQSAHPAMIQLGAAFGTIKISKI